MSGTVDFTDEIFRTAPDKIARRVGELSSELRGQILVEMTQRAQALAREEESLRARVEQMSYHIERLEKMIVAMSQGKPHKA